MFTLQKERIKLPSVERGVDYGKDRYLLLQKGKLRLEWTPGHTAWSSVGQTSYYPGHLDIRDTTEAWDRNHIDVFEGGRCSVERLVEARNVIAKAFKVRVYMLPDLSLKRTYIWEK